MNFIKKNYPKNYENLFENEYNNYNDSFKETDNILEIIGNWKDDYISINLSNNIINRKDHSYEHKVIFGVKLDSVNIDCYTDGDFVFSRT